MYVSFSRISYSVYFELRVGRFLTVTMRATCITYITRGYFHTHLIFIFTQVFFLSQTTGTAQYFNLVPSAVFENVTATATDSENMISCFSPHNQLYSNNIEFNPVS